MISSMKNDNIDNDNKKPLIPRTKKFKQQYNYLQDGYCYSDRVGTFIVIDGADFIGKSALVDSINKTQETISKYSSRSEAISALKTAANFNFKAFNLPIIRPLKTKGALTQVTKIKDRDDMELIINENNITDVGYCHTNLPYGLFKFDTFNEQDWFYINYCIAGLCLKFYSEKVYPLIMKGVNVIVNGWYHTLNGVNRPMNIKPFAFHNKVPLPIVTTVFTSSDKDIKKRYTDHFGKEMPDREFKLASQLNNHFEAHARDKDYGVISLANLKDTDIVRIYTEYLTANIVSH